jgi:methenyltetrahydrofolate cyclohydrolase
VSAALADRTLERLLEDLAAETPAPGGGCATAWTCALAASLVEMTAAFTIGRPDLAERHPRMEEIAARARSLRATALAVGERELHSYEPVLHALRLPKDDPDRSIRLDAALSDAAQTPFELARVAVEVAELALEAAEAGAPHLRGDALTAVLLADGACQAAARLVRINLAQRTDDPRLRELHELTRRVAAARSSTQ